CSTHSTATSISRSRPTTPVRAQCRSTTAFRHIARLAPTWRRSAPRTRARCSSSTLSPLQFRAQHVEIVLVRRLHQQNALLRFADADVIALRDRQSFLPIECQKDLLV